MATVAVTQFGDRLVDAVAHKRSQLVVGLDPVAALLPAAVGGDAEAFCRGVVDAVAEVAVAVKPQSAFFEVLGAEGVAAFRRICAYAREAGLLVIADVKRGDIASTAAAYADAFIPLADAVTVNPYLGRDSLEPFVDACRRHGAGLFCLVKTSNPGSRDVQDVQLADGCSGSTWRSSSTDSARTCSATRGSRPWVRSWVRRFPPRSRRRGASCHARRFSFRASARRAARRATSRRRSRRDPRRRSSPPRAR